MRFAQKRWFRRVARPFLIVALLYATWIGMMATHECGHVLHAWLSDGRVGHVSLPLLGFSRTDLLENPHPVFVVWGGPIWGCLMPLALLALVTALRWRFRRLLLFFAGFCLIANGAYMAFGSLDMAGDTGDLLRHGEPTWRLIAFGAVTVSLGLYLWHWLGPIFRPKSEVRRME